MRKLMYLLCAFCIISITSSAFAMDITPYDSAANMAQALVGAGVSIFNVSYTGATAASGYFSGGMAAGIGIGSGIVLTSGYASNLNGVSNTNDGITGNNGLGGDSDLNALGYSTNDATVLEFDFTSTGDTAYFNYVFGSDEYNEYTNTSYNDVFAFFFNGANVALIPGTSTPVSINNINAGEYSGYYNNNDNDDAPGAYPFEYDGFTDVFTAELLGLTAGDTYHIKLAIADVGDHVLDSGVFLQAGSFSEEPVDPGTNPVPEPATMILLGSGISGLIAYRKKMRK